MKRLSLSMEEDGMQICRLNIFIGTQSNEYIESVANQIKNIFLNSEFEVDENIVKGDKNVRQICKGV